MSAVLGCGGKVDGISREPVSGTVTFDDQVLESGQITFTPVEGGERVVGAIIKNGRYTLSRSEGPSAGLHKVNIWSRQPTGKKIPSEDVPGTFVEEEQETIPEQYNRQSSLQADIKSGGENRFDFALKKGAMVPVRKEPLVRKRKR
jgi:hypothetical protein